MREDKRYRIMDKREIWMREDKRYRIMDEEENLDERREEVG